MQIEIDIKNLWWQASSKPPKEALRQTTKEINTIQAGSIKYDKYGQMARLYGILANIVKIYGGRAADNQLINTNQALSSNPNIYQL